MTNFFRRTYVLPAGLFVLALGLGLYELGEKSFWDDEAFSAMASQLLPVQDLLSFTVHHDQHTGPYHFILLLWSYAFQGNTEEWFLRLPSAVFGAGAVVLFYATVRRLYGMSIAAVAGLALALNGFYLAYAQEARPYALALLLTCFAMWRFVIAATNPQRRSNWLWWGFAAGLCIYGHPFAVIVAISALLSLIALPRWETRTRDIELGVLVAGLTLMPMLALLVLYEGERLSWTQSFGLVPLAAILYSITGRGNPAMMITVAFSAAAFAVSSLLAFKRLRKGEDVWRDLLVTLWVGVLPVFVIAVSLSRSLLVGRYLIPAFPAIVLATVLFVWRLRNRVTQGVLAVALVASTAGAVTHWYGYETRDDWRSLTAYVANHSQAGDGIIFTRSNRLPFEYYLLKNGDEDKVAPISPIRDWGTKLPNEEKLASLDSSAGVREVVVPHKRVWLPYLEERGIDPLLAATLQELYGPPSSETFDGLVLRLYASPELPMNPG